MAEFVWSRLRDAAICFRETPSGPNTVLRTPHTDFTAVDLAIHPSPM
jgi:hypothetical protein